MRNAKFSVSFAYVTSPTVCNGLERMSYGELEPRNMSGEDTERLVKMLNPLRSKEWICQLNTLGRRGYMELCLSSVEEGNVGMKKVLRIERN